MHSIWGRIQKPTYLSHPNEILKWSFHKFCLPFSYSCTQVQSKFLSLSLSPLSILFRLVNSTCYRLTLKQGSDELSLENHILTHLFNNYLLTLCTQRTKQNYCDIYISVDGNRKIKKNNQNKEKVMQYTRKLKRHGKKKKQRLVTGHEC